MNKQQFKQEWHDERWRKRCIEQTMLGYNYYPYQYNSRSAASSCLLDRDLAKDETEWPIGRRFIGQSCMTPILNNPGWFMFLNNEMSYRYKKRVEQRKKLSFNNRVLSLAKNALECIRHCRATINQH